MIQIRSAEPGDMAWILDVTRDFGSPVIIADGKFRDLRTLPARIAMLDEERVGVMVYRIDAIELEALVLRALVTRRGIGRALMEDIVRLARLAGCRRAYLSTTNDNLPARNLHESVGFTLVRTKHGGFADVLRMMGHDPAKTKMIGYQGQPITDVLSYELRLSPGQSV